MSNLEAKLDKLLAEEFGISPEQVTYDFLNNWRERVFQPSSSYDTTSIYGGYLSHRKNVLTDHERKMLLERSNAFLDKYSKEGSKLR